MAQSLNSSNKLQHRSVRCCYLSCGMLSVCLNTRSYHKCSPESRKVCKFWCQIFYASLEYIAEILLFLCTTQSLRPQQAVLTDCTVHKICCSVCQKSFVFSTVCCSLGRHCFQNEGIEECGRSNRVPLLLNKMESSTAHLWTNNLLGCDAGHAPFELQVQKLCTFLRR